MTKRTGKQQVVFYEGVIPKSGLSVFEFGGRKFCHRSIKKDKSDYLVDVESKVTLMAYPLGSDRSLVLNHLAENIHKLEHYLRHPESYEVVSRKDLFKEEVIVPLSVLETVPSPHNLSWKDVEPKAIKKKYNMMERKW